MSKVKVGDMVRVKCADYPNTDAANGCVVEVMTVSNAGGVYVGSDYLFLLRGEYEAVSNVTTTQYIRILEAIMGDDAVTMAKNIHEALKDAS